jgi:molecular chaperone GrpE (heat shock protein)
MTLNRHDNSEFEMDLGVLEKIAASATPGPWFDEPEEWSQGVNLCIAAQGEVLAVIPARNEEEAESEAEAERNPFDVANATFMATFNPEKVLQLLEALKEARDRSHHLEQALEEIREITERDEEPLDWGSDLMDIREIAAGCLPVHDDDDEGETP